MKKIFLTILLLSVIKMTTAQSLFKIGLTYTIGKEQSLLGKKKDTQHEKNVNSSFGAGLTIDVGYVYLDNHNFGPEGTFSFFLGKPKTTQHSASANSDSITVVHRKMLFFSPALFVIGKNNSDINPYLSSGLLFNLWQNVTKTEYAENNNGEKTEKIWKVNYNRGIGYKSKIGVLHNTTDDFALFAEVQYQMISISYKNELLNNYTVNSKDLLSTLNLSERERVYYPELTHDSNTQSNSNFDINKATAINLKYANHNHFGASIGGFLISQ